MVFTPHQVESVKEGKAVTLLPPEVGQEGTPLPAVALPSQLDPFGP
jgi:hypothetical protein